MIHGINIHKIFPWETWMYSAITELGIDFVRVDLNWNEMEFERGKWNPDYEAMINTLTAKNVQIFATLAYTPAWLTDNFRKPPPISEWEKSPQIFSGITIFNVLVPKSVRREMIICIRY